MSPRQPLKLLLLHGYTQSGPLFHIKSRALIKHITKAFPLHEVSAIYPTGPFQLSPSDIPGFDPSQPPDPDDVPSIFAWYRRADAADPPLYVGLEAGLEAVAKTIREEGPFDGVVGFSQGAAMAGMVAALLDGDDSARRDAFGKFATSPAAMEYPRAFADESLRKIQPPLKFAVCYSGFRAPGPRYRGFYEDPPIRTPVLHVLGSLDTVVDEGRSRSLIEACVGDPEKEGNVVWHPGGHFVPAQRPYLDAVVVFVRKCLGGGVVGGKGEEDVNDMDVPF
ncbi:alpha/beta hydrolase [Aspergillus candidus]|uniref:FSH1-domain-containing protein n=1 Tax=Aspergillus candidus TaxID=41067 RepID=A0A2I2FF53_ASPCN|nr:FSH1-domain-containing protein [Aspergillus candidus]PLB39257.1 FSH1-domain-containing protein [Aspergillus candidus]